jgi:hypothetical protein
VEVKKYQVRVNDVVREYEEGTTFETISTLLFRPPLRSIYPIGIDSIRESMTC